MKRRRSAVLKVFLSLAAFTLTAASNISAQASEKILYSFTGGSDGSLLEAGLIFGGKGNLYSTAAFGGSAGGCFGCGTVFELSLGPNGTWTEKVLYSFTGSDGDGSNPYGGLVFDSKGNLYGTTESGGTTFIYGTVFELTPGTNDTWTEKVLYRFSGGPDGGLPVSGLILDEAGNLLRYY
jgi:hypothetical protein